MKALSNAPLVPVCRVTRMVHRPINNNTRGNQ